MAANTLSRFDTEYSADSVEFCPQPGYEDLLACGTYQLDERMGTSSHEKTSWTLLYASLELSNSVPLRNEVFRFDQPAILDMKWTHSPTLDGSPLLAIADAEGHVSLRSWNADKNTLDLQHTIQCGSPTTLCLSLDWSGRLHRSFSQERIVVSRSDGQLALIQQTEAEWSMTDEWKAHEYDPWIAAWDYWDTNVIYSGGDDYKLKGWDTRQGFDAPTFANKKFDSGLTSIQSHPHIEHILAVGSYDSTMRLFDTRQLSSPFSSIDVGGGVWRIKWHPESKRRGDLVAACMHDGFKVVRFPGLDSSSREGKGGGEPSVLVRNDSHASLGYGVDWQYGIGAGSGEEQEQNGREGNGDGDATLVASCSFYDHLLTTWRG